MRRTNETLAQQAEAFYQQGAWEQADALYQSLLKEQPSYPDTLLRLGQIAIQRQEFATAIYWLEHAILQTPSRGDVHYHLANVLAAVNKWHDAQYHLQQAIHLSPNYAEAHNNLGRIFHKHNQLQQAEHHYHQALKNNPSYVEASINLGLLYLMQGALEKAKRHFQDILQWHSSAIVYEQLAQIAWQEKDLDQAKYYYQALMQFPIHSSDTWNNIGGLFSQLKEYDLALEYFTYALKNNSKHKSARSNRAAIYLQQRRLKEAVWDYTLYLRLAADDSEAHYNFGVALMLSGRLDDALASFKKAIELNGYYIQAWCNIGAIYVQQSQISLAYEAYQKVLLYQPDHKTAQYIVSALLQSDCFSVSVAEADRVVPTQAPIEYIQALFDNYADYFDRHLTETLSYQVPKQLYCFMEPYLTGKQWDTLDLGCGTGLAGVAFQTVVKRLIGVDISSQMLREANKKAIYHECVEANLVDFLKHTTAFYELVLCVDTLVYFGELTEILAGVFALAKQGAYFGFSVEMVDTGSKATLADYYLQPTGRYQHNTTAIRCMAEQQGWCWVDMTMVQGRKHQGQPVAIGLCLLQKKG